MDVVEVSVDTDPDPESYSSAFPSSMGDVVHILRGGQVYYIRSNSVYVLPHVYPSDAVDVEAKQEPVPVDSTPKFIKVDAKQPTHVCTAHTPSSGGRQGDT